MQALCLEVGRAFVRMSAGCRNVYDIECSSFEMITNEMIANVDVFRSSIIAFSVG
jgi:hypothetical protein